MELRIDLLGDGLPAPTIVRGEDLRAVAALTFVPPRVGRYSAHVYAVDSCGREGATGLERPVSVHP